MTPVEQTSLCETGPRLKKFTRDECAAIAAGGVNNGDIVESYAPDGPERRRWTRDEVEALRKSGAVDVDRLELVNGELYDKTGNNRPHVNAQHRILWLLSAVFGKERVTLGSPIDVDRSDRVSSEPVPDIVVTDRDVESFHSSPHPEDVILIVEASDTTLQFDVRDKAELYARAGIVEYWVVDLNGRVLVVHRQPEQGRYGSVVSYSGEEIVRPVAATEASVLVRDLFPL